jgi:hypothetical protein
VTSVSSTNAARVTATTRSGSASGNRVSTNQPANPSAAPATSTG